MTANPPMPPNPNSSRNQTGNPDPESAPTEFLPPVQTRQNSPQGAAAGSRVRNPKSGNNPAAKKAADKRKKIIIASVAGGVAAVALVVVLIVLLVGGDSQGAQSACTKAASDFTEAYDDLQNTAEEAQQTLNQSKGDYEVDAALLNELELKTQKAQKELKPLPCTGKTEEIAKNTQTMMEQTEDLMKQRQDLEDTMMMVQQAQNAKSLSSSIKELEEAINHAEETVRQAQSVGADSAATSQLRKQIDDSKKLLQDVKGKDQISDDNVNELNQSLRDSTKRLNEGSENLAASVNSKILDDARKKAAEQARQEQLRKQQSEAEKPQPPANTTQPPEPNNP